MIDLRSDLMGPRTREVAEAMRDAVLRPGAMDFGEDADERRLSDQLTAEFGVEAVLLVPTCTMANQIAIRLHLPDGGQLSSSARDHVVTVEARATALTGVVHQTLSAENGHLSPSVVSEYLNGDTRGESRLVWLENTHMLSAGSVMPSGWQTEIGVACRAAGAALHLDGSRLWNAAVAQEASMATLMTGCDTAAISLNKAIGAPVGSVLAGSRAAIEQAVRWRDVMGGNWRPLGGIAAAALVALQGWRPRLATDLAMTQAIADSIVDRLGEGAILPARPT
jgi:threonine aldolase